MFDGIKMGAVVLVNGIQVASAEDQYVRYTVPLAATGVKLRQGANANTVVVKFDPAQTVNGRFMACTGTTRSCSVLLSSSCVC